MQYFPWDTPNVPHEIRFVALDKRAITQGHAVFPFSLCSLNAAIARSWKAANNVDLDHFPYAREYYT